MDHMHSSSLPSQSKVMQPWALQCSMLNWSTSAALQAMQRFVVQDLSNFYLDIAKDRLYVRQGDSSDRRACQTVLAALLQVQAPLDLTLGHLQHKPAVCNLQRGSRAYDACLGDPQSCMCWAATNQ